jgi:hypothetical protein
MLAPGLRRTILASQARRQRGAVMAVAFADSSPATTCSWPLSRVGQGAGWGLRGKGRAAAADALADHVAQIVPVDGRAVRRQTDVKYSFGTAEIARRESKPAGVGFDGRCGSVILRLFPWSVSSVSPAPRWWRWRSGCGAGAAEGRPAVLTLAGVRGTSGARGARVSMSKIRQGALTREPEITTPVGRATSKLPPIRP